MEKLVAGAGDVVVVDGASAVAGRAQGVQGVGGIFESPGVGAISAEEAAGVLETMAGVFARHNISVKSIVQRGRSGAERVDQVVVTHRCRERDIREALEEALALDNVVLDTPSVIRVEE